MLFAYNFELIGNHVDVVVVGGDSSHHVLSHCFERAAHVDLDRSIRC